MPTQETITIKFKPDGHEALTRAIKDLDKATRSLTDKNKAFVASGKPIGGANDKISSSYLRMETRLKSVGKSMKSLGVSTNVLSLAKKGDVVATEKLRIAYKKLNSQGALNVKTNRLLNGTFATLRSQLLLFHFAMGMGIRQLIIFAKEATKLQSMERAFTTLSGGVDSAGIAMNKLQSATDGTMSKFDLFQQANNAMILGVSNNSDEMAEMFDMAQRLGEALGKDTRMSVESLITGIGRQCLTEDSFISTDNGLKQITDIKKGDVVLSKNDNDEIIETVVTHLHYNGIHPVYIVTFKDGKFIKSTDNHRYFTDDGWKYLSELDSGSKVLNIDNNYSIIHSIIALGNEKVYDLTVPETANFYANGLCVHNSRLMLDNIGIIVKSDEAYQKHAAQLNKTADQLTDSEKKQAFLNATLESARQKIALLPPEIQTAERTFASFGASIDDAQASLGEAFLPILESTAEGLENISKAMTPERVRAYAAVITGSLVVAMTIYISKLKEAALWQTRIGWGVLITGAGILAAELLKLTGVFDSVGNKIDKINKTSNAYIESLKSMAVAELSIQKILKENQLARLKNSESYKADQDAIAEWRDEYKTAKNAIDGVSKELENLKGHQGIDQEYLNSLLQKKQFWASIREELIKARPATDSQTAAIESQISTIDIYLQTLGNFKGGIEELESAQAKALQLYLKTPEAQTAMIDGNIATIESLIEVEGATTQYTAIMKMLSEQRIKIADKEFQKKQQLIITEIGMYGKLITASGHLLGMNKKNAKLVANIQAIAAVVNAFAAAQTSFAQAAKNPFTIANPAYPKIVYATTLISGLAQAAALKSQADSMEQGGLIGGRRHSQGGTIIEAEKGEFIMSRKAVQSIGLENLNAMNQGNTTNNTPISISINGGMVDQSFVENELADAIKTAIRRGSDFGVA